MIKPFKIATWKANRLAKHSQDIKTFIFNQEIDILLVSETYFINETYYRELLSLDTYYITQCILMVKVIEEPLLI